MSGHSKWSTIKRQKGVADVKRGQTFTKLAGAIAIAARAGGSGDPLDNPRLRMVIEEAKAVNMPKDNIARAIDRGLGKLPGQNLEEVTYEGFGPAGVAFYIEAVTDNKLRTHSEIKNLFDRSGGSLAGQGATAYMFSPKGEIKVVSRGGNLEAEMLELIDLGAEDVIDYLDINIRKYLVYVQSPEINTMGTKVTQAGYRVEQAKIVYKPTTIIEVKDPESAKKILEFSEKVMEHDDIQEVYANFDIPGELTV